MSFTSSMNSGSGSGIPNVVTEMKLQKRFSRQHREEATCSMYAGGPTAGVMGKEERTLQNQ